ncbi:MAG: glycoside hydrolase family 97 C-terminal domain-containing protein, partial [Flavobacteriaceae bacterium]|nr:glycoside hydrolase family 97 C-terminal domain-containing protein [Flavobacteriaceae bacterium]
DGENAHWNENPTDLNIKKIIVTQNSEIKLKLAPGGGAAINIIKK